MVGGEDAGGALVLRESQCIVVDIDGLLAPGAGDGEGDDGAVFTVA